MSFSKQFKQLRLENGVTQETLGDIINVSGRTVGYYESGQRFPSENTLIRIADYFDVSIDYLLGRTIKEKHSHSSLINTDENLPEKAKIELSNFKEYLEYKYSKY